tara:strand:+ start:137 stop:550 length:414 start_codon:yes stop_codon:yes gene_type:complete
MILKNQYNGGHKMSNCLYTEDHEWLKVDGNIALVGITNHAADELGEIVYLELLEVKENLSKGDEFGSVESVKTVSGLYSPITGKIIEINQEAVDSPDVINQSPYDKGWLIKIEFDNTEEIDELMNEHDYQSFIKTLN